MSFVLEYTVVPEQGKPRIVEGVSHLDALSSVVKGISTMKVQSQIDKADYEPDGDEEITVIGFVQEDYANFQFRSGPAPKNKIVTFKLHSYIGYRPEYIKDEEANGEAAA